MTISPIRQRTYAPAIPSRTQSLDERYVAHNVFQRLGGIGTALLNRRSMHQSARYAGNGYHYQADEVMHCVRDGRLESAIMPLSETVCIMHVMDVIRSQWAVRSGATSADGANSPAPAGRSGGKP